MDAKRCLNCLSVEHFVRDCPYPSKCRKCGSGCQNKHSGASHECYNGKSLGAAELTVLEEREGVDPEEPNYVLTRLGPIASGGRASRNLCSSGSLSALRANINSSVENEYNKLKEENIALKQSLREYELLDEVIQPSKNDELALQLLEPSIKVVEGRYEMPVPLKSQMVNDLPNNYENALKRTMSLRKTTQRNPSLKQTLVDTFTELITENWIEPVEENICVGVNSTWYLLFFVTKTAKPRVVYDGSATFKGISLNQIVLSGENLLNNLLDVLIRFWLGKFACVADLSKCFFQVRLPKNQQDLFRLMWLLQLCNRSEQVTLPQCDAETVV